MNTQHKTLLTICRHRLDVAHASGLDLAQDKFEEPSLDNRAERAAASAAFDAAHRALQNHIASAA